MRTPLLKAVFVILLAPLAQCADWSPRLAAEYLEGRQKEWFAWPAAKAPGGPCISCHTGMTYLLARPALRKALGELPAEQGRVVWARMYEDKTFAQIAEEFGLPLGTVLTRMRLALEKLRRTLHPGD